MTRAPEVLRGQRVVITGAAGFLGSHQVRALRQTAQVHTVSRKALPADPLVTHHLTDLANRDATLALLDSIRPDYVIHLAGFANGGQGIENLYPSLTGDLMTTVHILEACHASGCGRLVIAGSLEESERDAPAPSPYAVAKRASSDYAELCHRLYGLAVVTVRIFMTYGPGQPAHKLIPQMITHFSHGKTFDLRSAQRAVDWIYVDDVTDAILLSATTPGLEGRTLDIGSGVLTPVGDLAKSVARMMDREELLRIVAPDRRNERVRKANLAETEPLIGWRPTVSLDDGLRRTIDALATKEAVR